MTSVHGDFAPSEVVVLRAADRAGLEAAVVSLGRFLAQALALIRNRLRIRRGRNRPVLRPQGRKQDHRRAHCRERDTYSAYDFSFHAINCRF